MQNPQTNLRPRGNLRESYLSPRAGSEFDFETPRTRTTRMGTRGRGDRLSPIQDEEDEEIERPSIATRSRQGYATSRFPSYADVFAQPAEGQRPGAPRINSRSQFPHYVEEDGQPFATRIDSRSRIQTPLHNVPQSARSRQPTPFPQIPTRRTLNVRFPVQTKITTITRTISRTQLTHPQARPLGTPDSPSFEQASNPFFNRPTSRAPQNIPNIARPGGVRNPFSDSDDEDSDSVDQDEDEVPITPRVHHRPGSPSSRPAPRTPNLSRPLDSPPETPESRPESPPSPDQERVPTPFQTPVPPFPSPSRSHFPQRPPTPSTAARHQNHNPTPHPAPQNPSTNTPLAQPSSPPLTIDPVSQRLLLNITPPANDPLTNSPSPSPIRQETPPESQFNILYFEIFGLLLLLALQLWNDVGRRETVVILLRH